MNYFPQGLGLSFPNNMQQLGTNLGAIQTGSPTIQSQPSVFQGYQPQLYQPGNQLQTGAQAMGQGGFQAQPTMEDLAAMVLSLADQALQFLKGPQANNNPLGQPQPGQAGLSQPALPQPGQKGLPDKNPHPVNFKSNKSINKRLDQLAGLDPKVNKLYSKLKKADPESPQSQQLEGKLTAAMQKAGYSDKQVQQFFSLHQAAGLNKQISGIKKTNPAPESPQVEQLNALRSNRLQLENQYLTAQ